MKTFLANKLATSRHWNRLWMGQSFLFVARGREIHDKSHLFLIWWRIMTLAVLWQDTYGSCSMIWFKYLKPIFNHNQQRIGLTAWTITTMILSHSLLPGGQSGGLQDIYISFEGGRIKCSKCNNLSKETMSTTLVRFMLYMAENMLINNVGNDWMRVEQGGQPP